MAQARAAARRAGLDRHKLLELVAHHIGRRLLIAAAHHGNNAFKSRGILLHFAAQIFILEDARVVRAPHQLFLQLAGQLVIAAVQRKAIGLEQAAELAHKPRIGVAAQSCNSAVGKGFRCIRQH